MRVIKLPYHLSYIDLKIAEENLQNVLISKKQEEKTKEEQRLIIENALDNPINSVSLEHLAKEKKNILIVTSDHTRPMPSSITLPILLKRIRGSNSNCKIRIVIATGTHRITSKKEMLQMFGKEIVKKEEIIVHDAYKEENIVSYGTLSNGLNLKLNKVISQSDLVIAEGFIEPHFFAGYSGGRKSIFPGLASIDTIKANHCANHISDFKAKNAVLENNPIHLEASEAAKKARLAFILNVALNHKKQIVKAFAGDMNLAFLTGCAYVKKQTSVQASLADIVIVTNGGYPLDQNIYQAVKGLDNAVNCCRKDAVIIMIAACKDGHGGEAFYQIFKKSSSLKATAKKINNTERDKTVNDQWQAQILIRVLLKHQVIMVSDVKAKQIINDMFMQWAPDINTALEMAYQIKGRESKVVVIPDGVSVILT